MWIVLQSCESRVGFCHAERPQGLQCSHLFDFSQIPLLTGLCMLKNASTKMYLRGISGGLVTTDSCYLQASEANKNRLDKTFFLLKRGIYFKNSKLHEFALGPSPELHYPVPALFPRSRLGASICAPKSGKYNTFLRHKEEWKENCSR